MSDYESLVERVRLKCTECGDCWVWTGALSHGTPVMSVRAGGKKSMQSVRRLLLVAKGKDPGRKLATTGCETALCVSPEHLVAMTRQALTKRSCLRTGYANRLDRRAKVQAASKARRKLTDEQAAEVRASNLLLRELAAKYGVAKETIGAIRRGKSYRNYTGPFAGLLGLSR